MSQFGGDYTNHRDFKISTMTGQHLWQVQEVDDDEGGGGPPLHRAEQSSNWISLFM